MFVQLLLQFSCWIQTNLVVRQHSQFFSQLALFSWVQTSHDIKDLLFGFLIFFFTLNESTFLLLEWNCEAVLIWWRKWHWRGINSPLLVSCFLSAAMCPASPPPPPVGFIDVWDRDWWTYPSYMSDPLFEVPHPVTMTASCGSKFSKLNRQFVKNYVWGGCVSQICCQSISLGDPEF